MTFCTRSSQQPDPPLRLTTFLTAAEAEVDEVRPNTVTSRAASHRVRLGIKSTDLLVRPEPELTSVAAFPPNSRRQELGDDDIAPHSRQIRRNGDSDTPPSGR
jgi:hypothetical protein